MKSGGSEFIFGSCYRPPKTDILKFTKEDRDLIRRMQKTRSNLIIGMAHNIDLLKTATHHNTQHFLETNVSEGMFPTILRPTRITKSTATLLDNIFINEELYASDMTHIILDNISDHLPCSLVINNIHRRLREGLEIMSLNLKLIPNLVSALNDCDWTFTSNTEIDTNEKFNMLHELVTNKIQQTIPYTTKKIPYHKLCKEPWVSAGLMNSMRKEKRLYKDTLSKEASDQKREKYQNYNLVL